MELFYFFKRCSSEGSGVGCCGSGRICGSQSGGREEVGLWAGWVLEQGKEHGGLGPEHIESHRGGEQCGRCRKQGQLSGTVKKEKQESSSGG